MDLLSEYKFFPATFLDAMSVGLGCLPVPGAGETDFLTGDLDADLAVAPVEDDLETWDPGGARVDPLKSKSYYSN